MERFLVLSPDNIFKNHSSSSVLFFFFSDLLQFAFVFAGDELKHFYGSFDNERIIDNEAGSRFIYNSIFVLLFSVPELLVRPGLI